MHFPVFPFQAGAVAHLRPNHFIQCQITDLIRSDKVHKSQLCELVSARAAVNNGVITPAIAPPPTHPSKNNLVPTQCAVRGVGGSLGAHGPQIQQLKSRRAARKRGKKVIGNERASARAQSCSWKPQMKRAAAALTYMLSGLSRWSAAGSWRWGPGKAAGGGMRWRRS